MTTLQEIAEQIVRKFMRADGSQAQLQADILTALESARQEGRDRGACQSCEALRKERDHERHEKETVADAAAAHAEWTRKRIAELESSLASAKAEALREAADVMDDPLPPSNACFDFEGGWEAGVDAFRNALRQRADQETQG